jgi:hypothetical protein
MSPRAGLDDVENRKFLTLLGLELRILGRPARSQSLYQLRYPGSLNSIKFVLLIQLTDLFCLQFQYFIFHSFGHSIGISFVLVVYISAELK